jgi:2-phosphoglycerate kinase
VDELGVQPRVIIFTGLPGTGKSTLAEKVARTVGAPAFAGDWLMGGLKPAHAALSQLDRAQYLAAWFGLLRTLVTRQLLDQSGWDHVERMRVETTPPTVDRLTVDAVEPVEDNFRRVLDYIRT